MYLTKQLPLPKATYSFCRSVFPSDGIFFFCLEDSHCISCNESRLVINFCMSEKGSYSAFLFKRYFHYLQDSMVTDFFLSVLQRCLSTVYLLSLFTTRNSVCNVPFSCVCFQTYSLLLIFSNFFNN